MWPAAGRSRGCASGWSMSAATRSATSRSRLSSPLDRTILAGTETHWEATIRNDSPRVLSRAKAILRVDDRPTEIPLPEIPPRQAVRVPLTVRFPSQGMHDISLQLPEDELPGDNQLWAAVPVKDSLLIRLVDGEPSSEPFGSEVDYLAAPLSIGVGDAEAWRVEVVQEENFLNPRLEPADVLVLANVAAPTAEQAGKLAQLVRGGMGLMIFTGGEAGTGLYNERLYRSGERLLPVPLKAQVDEAIRGVVVEAVRPVADREAAGAEALGAGARCRPPVHGVDEPAGDPGRSGCWPAGTTRRGLPPWSSGSSARAGSCSGRPPRTAPATTGRSSRVSCWRFARPCAGRRGRRRMTIPSRRASGRRRVVRSSHQLANVRLTPPGGGEPKSLTSACDRRPDAGRHHAGLGDRRSRHAPGGALSRVVGRGAAGHPAGSLRVQPRRAGKRARAARRGRPQGDARSAERRGRRGEGRRQGRILGDRPGALA